MTEEIVIVPHTMTPEEVERVKQAWNDQWKGIPSCCYGRHSWAEVKQKDNGAHVRDVCIRCGVKRNVEADR